MVFGFRVKRYDKTRAVQHRFQDFGAPAKDDPTVGRSNAARYIAGKISRDY